MAIVTGDKYINYDYDKHIYIPTLALFQDKLDVNENSFGGTKEFELFAEDVANFIKDFCVFYNTTEKSKYTIKTLWEYLVYKNAYDEVYDLKRAYVEFARYALDNQGDKVGTQTGIDWSSFMALDENVLKGNRELSSRLQRVLRNSGLYWRGKWKWSVPDTVTRGTDF